MTRDVARADAGTGARAARNRIRRRDEGIRAVVEIEERRLRAFEQHVLPGVERFVDEPDRVRDVRLEPRPADLEILTADLVDVDGELVVDLGQHRVDGVQHDLELCRKILGSSRSCTRSPTRMALSAYAGPDAAPRGAQRVAAEVTLVQRVELHVIGQDQSARCPTRADGCSRRASP